MTLHCPSCDEELEFDFDPHDQTFDCPAIFFGIMGVFIANLTEGQAGSREALRGAVLNFLIIAAPGIADLISK